jgi:ABC-2 type transport system permease protein
VLTSTATVLRQSALAGFADYAILYTPRSWTFGWLGRVLCQVAFFALIGRLLGSPEAEHSLLVGNAVMMAAVDSLFVVSSTTWERRAGTLPLLVCSPTSPLLVFTGRSVQWVVSGTATTLISLFGLGLLFGVPMATPAALAAVPLVALVSTATYFFGLTLGALVLRAMELRIVVNNVIQLVMMAICGVQVPVEFWPRWVEYVATVLPVTHGLAAVRTALAGGPAGRVAAEGALEAAVAAGWLVLAGLVFDRLAERGRRDGSIEFGD